MDWDRIRQRFRMLREQSGLSQDDVGELVKMTGSAISMFETGGSKSRVSNLERYCEAIDAVLIYEIVPKEDAELVRRLVDVLPWANRDGRKMIRHAIKVAELLRRNEQPEAGTPDPTEDAPEMEYDEEPSTTGVGRGRR